MLNLLDFPSNLSVRVYACVRVYMPVCVHVYICVCVWFVFCRVVVTWQILGTVAGASFGHQPQPLIQLIPPGPAW